LVRLEEQAKELIRLRQKTRALLVLKLKKYKEKEIENIDGQLLNILKMIEDVEWASINVEVMKSLESGTKTLNRIHDEMSVEGTPGLPPYLHYSLFALCLRCSQEL
jgi:hypothetical protein